MGCFRQTRVKAIAQQDESIGKMAAEATSLIARCAEAFLADLVNVSVDRARAAGDRGCKRKGRSTPSSRSLRQVLPEDVRKAAMEEERFDFLRPVLEPPNQDKKSVSAYVGGTRKGNATAGRSRKNPRTDKNGEGRGSGGTIGGIDAVYGAGCGAGESAAAEGNSLVALGGLDDESRRAFLLGDLGMKGPSVSGIGDEEDEDYDNL